MPRITYWKRMLPAIVIVLMTSACPALAHDPSLSGIGIENRQKDVVVKVTTHISRLLRAEGKGALLSPVELDLAIRRRLRLRFDNKVLLPKEARVIGDNTNDLLSWQTVVPYRVIACEVTARLYPEDPNSRTVVTIQREGQAVQEALLDADHPDLLNKQPRATPLAIALQYIREGIEHIFGGPDHVLFVLGLILMGGALRSLLRTVTAFTIAHSITLTLAATGVYSPSPRIVEPLIALSIVAVAVENLCQVQRKREAEQAMQAILVEEIDKQQIWKERDLRPYYAFGFGLIHGFGFAGALAEIGLPHFALGLALASFNIGVEIGQVLIILITLPGLVWLGRVSPVMLRKLVLACSLVIGIAGSYWFFMRSLLS